MQTYFLNETSVRTSVNYGINNIKVELNVPNEDEQREFENFSIASEDSEKIDVKVSEVNAIEDIKDSNLANEDKKDKIKKIENSSNNEYKKDDFNDEYADSKFVNKNENSKLIAKNEQKDNLKLTSRIGLNFSKYKKIEINIPDNTEIKDTIFIDFLFDDDNKYLVDNIKINVGKNAKARFVIEYLYDGNLNHLNEVNKVSDDQENELMNKNDSNSSIYNDLKNENHEINSKYFEQNRDSLDETVQCFHNLLLEAIVNENAECNIICSNTLSENSDSFMSFENVLEENAKLEYTIVDLGGKNKISNFHSDLKGDLSYNKLNNIYLGTKNDVIDINYNIDAIGKKTKCIIESQGAISGLARKNFKGIIDFKQGSTKSVGKENENCLILSNDAKSRSLPVLLCHEEDVNGEHGVSSGKPNEQKMFYMMSKGISYDDARKLLVKANFNNILESIKDNDLVSQINEIINREIN